MKRRTRSLKVLLILIVATGCAGVAGNWGILSGVLGIGGTVRALEYQDNLNIQFDFNSTMSLTVSGDLVVSDLMPGNAADSNVITVTAASNNVSGYSLYASVGSSGSNYTDLRISSSDSTNVFSALTSTAATLNAISNNEWGYSYCDDTTGTGSGNVTNCSGTTNWVNGNTGSTTAGYGAMPLYSSSLHSGDVVLADTMSASNTELKFKIGAKAAATQVAGVYTNTVNFYVVAKEAPTSFMEAFRAAGVQQHNGYYKMQDMTADICSAVQVYDEDSQTQLVDIRDGKIYYVAKLQDGNCWMTQNLDLDLTSGQALTSETTNLTKYGTAPYTVGYGCSNASTTTNCTASGEIISWTPQDWTATATSGGGTVSATTRTPNASGSFSNWVNGTDASGADQYKDGYIHPLSANPGDWYQKGTYFNSTTCSFLTNPTGCTNYFTTTPDTVNGDHGHVGNYYNYTASIASNDTSGVNSNYQQNSICPANWRLPKNTEYTTLNTLYNDGRTGQTDPVTQGRDSGLFNAPLYLVRAGNVSGGTLSYPANYANNWSGTLNSSANAHYLTFHSTYVYPSYFSARWLGFSVRCLAVAE